MSIRSVTRMGRAFKRRTQLDGLTTGLLLRSTDSVDPLTGRPVFDEIGIGSVYINSYEPQERSAEVGGASLAVFRYHVAFDIDAGISPETGDLIRVTAAELDPQLAGREFVVRALLHKTAATAYRLGCDDNDGFGGAA